MLLYHLIKKLWNAVLYGMKHLTVISQGADLTAYLVAILLFHY